MNRKQIILTRIYSLLIPSCTDGALGLSTVAAPLLAIRLGADAWFLGVLGWLPQLVRFPFCFLSGSISDRVGRLQVILPAVGMEMLACMGIALSHGKTSLVGLCTLLLVSAGLFYPPFQAFVGDRSPQGQLGKNVSAFNIGWSVGGALWASLAGVLFAIRAPLPFILSAVLALVAMQLIFLWSRVPSPKAQELIQDTNTAAGSDPGALLVIARIGHFVAFFGIGVTRYLFPKLGTELGIPESSIGLIVSMSLVGQAVGMLSTSAGPWWRGKLWPQILAQVLMSAVGLAVFAAKSGPAFGALFLVQGAVMGVSYSGSLYYGMQARVKMGRSTGIHESLVTSGVIAGSFLGGIVGQFVSLRAPYAVFALMAGIGVVTSMVYWRRMKNVEVMCSP